MRVGSFEVTSVLGRGGMGVVYAAVDSSGRKVALKSILPELATDQEAVSRFRREGQAASAVVHPNVVRFIGRGEENGVPYLVFELVEGGSLKEKVAREGRLPWREAASIGAGIARGLVAIHAAGLIHRDLKPENVLVDADGTPRISDLGLVRLDTTLRAESHGLTNTGDVVGTPAYMAPEQAKGEKGVTASADLYALGGVLHFLMVGEPPFSGTGLTLLRKHILDSPRPVSETRPGVPPRLDRLVLQLLAKKPAQRPRSALKVVRELEAIVAGRERDPATWKPVAAIIALLGVVVAVGVGSASKREPAVARESSPREPPRAKDARSGPDDALPRNMRRGSTERLPGGEEIPLYLFPLPGGAGDMELVHVPAGDFIMGTDDAGAEDPAKPRHSCSMEHAYWIGRNDVTWAQYRAFCAATGRREPPLPLFWNRVAGPKEDHPVVMVSWDDAKDYTDWAGLDLPTEAEWEKAARGTDGRRYPWGDDWDPGARCNFCDASCPLDTFDMGDEKGSEASKFTNARWDRGHSDGFPFTSPVGRFPKGASPYGALDMAGNVLQLCEEWYDPEAYAKYRKGPSARPDINAFAARGGSWHDEPDRCTSSYRAGVRPGDRLSHLGFRVVLRSRR